MPIKNLIEKLHGMLDLDKCEDINYERDKVTKELRKDIIEEQKGRCFLCGCNTTIPLLHHIKPDGKSVKDNLAMLCPLCHKWIHWMLKKYLGYRASIEPWNKYG